MKSNLEGADLRGTRLLRANMEEADLRWANLEGSSSIRMNLHKAKLKKTNFEGADLFKADLSESNLSESNLTEACLVHANLEKANLHKTKFYKTDLRGARLNDSYKLRHNQVNSAKSLDEETKFPDYLEVRIIRENKWTCKEIDQREREQVTR